ncbi:DUF7657 domain-containing protein [Mumia zhuanghuii]|uniref:DUF7657 domain-containing protein n=1 Tax=Mumia zhuanghuii TaxID=2585211 RepID=UPI00363FA847
MSSAPAARSYRRARTRVLAFPLLVGLTLLLLVAANVNGSSMAVLSGDDDPPGLILGEPRPVRSDEYRLRTPIAISSVKQDFPRAPWIGLAPINQAATAHGGPTRDWSTMLKPQDWGYLLLGADRGFAWSWWWSFAIGLAGSYVLFLTLTRRIALSALTAIAATFTPYAAWWTAPPPSLFVGYGALAGGLFLLAVRARTQSWRITYAALAGLAGAGFALALYPPWQVPLVWVVGAVVLGRVIDERIGARHVVALLGVTATVAGVPLLTWLVQNRDAISATIGTYYPGQRITEAGSGSLSVLLDAPLNFWLAGDAGATLGADGRGGPWANLSESASSWFSVPVVVVIALVVLVETVRRHRLRPPTAEDSTVGGLSGHAAPAHWTLVLLLAAIGLLLAWTFLPLPDLLGQVTALNRVQPTRTALALGFAQVLLVAVAAGDTRLSARVRWAVVAVAAAGTGVTASWSARALPWDDTLAPALEVVVSGALLGGALMAVVTARRTAAAAALLAAYTVTSWIIVNPLQLGTAPLTAHPLARTLDRLGAAETNPRVAVVGGLDTVAIVRAAGLQSVSGTTPYPDTDLMNRLAPADERLWNNYAQYLWEPAPPGTDVTISQLRGAVMRLAVDLCDPVVHDQVDPGWVVADRRLSADCLTGAARVRNEGTGYWIYRVS